MVQTYPQGNYEISVQRTTDLPAAFALATASNLRSLASCLTFAQVPSHVLKVADYNSGRKNFSGSPSTGSPPSLGYFGGVPPAQHAPALLSRCRKLAHKLACSPWHCKPLVEPNTIIHVTNLQNV